MQANDLIQPMEVQRDENGYWSHPGIPDFDEDVTAFNAWLEAQGLVIKYKCLESEGLDHPAYVEYFDNGNPDVSAWNPAPPDGEGWFTFSIHDTEDGVVWVWARRDAGATTEPENT